MPKHKSELAFIDKPLKYPSGTLLSELFHRDSIYFTKTDKPILNERLLRTSLDHVEISTQAKGIK